MRETCICTEEMRDAGELNAGTKCTPQLVHTQQLIIGFKTNT